MWMEEFLSFHIIVNGWKDVPNHCKHLLNASQLYNFVFASLFTCDSMRSIEDRFARIKYIFQPFPIMWNIRNSFIHIEKRSDSQKKTLKEDPQLACLAIMFRPRQGYSCDLTMSVWCEIRRMVASEISLWYRKVVCDHFGSFGGCI